MSFSSLVKGELCGIYGVTHCSKAEMSAIIDTCGIINDSGIVMQTENAAVAKKYFCLIKKHLKLQGEVSIRNSRQFNRSRVYIVYTPLTEKLLYEKGDVVNRECCKRAFIRGAFLAGGSLSDPEKSYHLEFVNTDWAKSEYLAEMINSCGLKARVIKRKSHYIVYLKEGENIVDLLNIMGAHVSLLNLENLRIVKDMRNYVNRQVNCETANSLKTVEASIKQINDIKTIARIKGLGFLSEQLEAVAEIRLTHVNASLKEIGAMLSPPVSKSGVNHRLRKISEIADNLRGE